MALRVTAAVEILTAAACMVSPSLPIAVLFGAPLESLLDTFIARFVGVPLICLGLACWRAAGDHSGAASVLLTAMLLYHVLAAVLLAYAGLALRLTGIGLWPAVLAHLALAAGCVTALRPSGRPLGCGR